MSALLTYVVPPAGLAALGLIAEISGADFSTFFNYGVAGGVLLWFMLVITPQLKKAEENRHTDALNTQASIDRMSRSNIVLSLSLKVAATQEAAKSLDAELDRAQAARDAEGKK